MPSLAMPVVHGKQFLCCEINLPLTKTSSAQGNMGNCVTSPDLVATLGLAHQQHESSSTVSSFQVRYYKMSSYMTMHATLIVTRL